MEIESRRLLSDTSKSIALNHSLSVFFTNIPVEPSWTFSEKAPTSLAIIGTFTSAASIHLFSDLARLNIVSTRGAKAILHSAMIIGSSRQSTNPDVIILSLYGSSISGISRMPAILRYTCGYLSNIFMRLGITRSKSSL